MRLVQENESNGVSQRIKVLIRSWALNSLQSLHDDLVLDLDLISQKHLKAKKIVQTYTCTHLLL